MDSDLKMPPGPPPLPVRENVIQVFDRVYEARRRDIEAGCPVEDPAADIVMVPLARRDAVRLIDALEKLERRSNVGGVADTEALAWRVRVTVQTAVKAKAEVDAQKETK